MSIRPEWLENRLRTSVGTAVSSALGAYAKGGGLIMDAAAKGRADERQRIRQALADKGWRTDSDGSVPLHVILDLLDAP